MANEQPMTTVEENQKGRIDALEGLLHRVWDVVERGGSLPRELIADVGIAIGEREPTEEDRKRRVQDSVERGFYGNRS